MEVSQEFLFLKIAFKWETPFVGMLPKKASWDLYFAQETKGLPQTGFQKSLGTTWTACAFKCGQADHPFDCQGRLCRCRESPGYHLPENHPAHHSFILRNEVTTVYGDRKGSRTSENEGAPRGKGVSLCLWSWGTAQSSLLSVCKWPTLACRGRSSWQSSVIPGKDYSLFLLIEEMSRLHRLAFFTALTLLCSVI